MIVLLPSIELLEYNWTKFINFNAITQPRKNIQMTLILIKKLVKKHKQLKFSDLR